MTKGDYEKIFGKVIEATKEDIEEAKARLEDMGKKSRKEAIEKQKAILAENEKRFQLRKKRGY